MPHSIFTGRVQQPGEPLFLDTDTAAAIALAEEERDTCTKCGYLKAWCREGSLLDLHRFEVEEETCWATYRLAARREKLAKAHRETQDARLLSVRFRDGYTPDLAAGLGFDLEPDGAEEQVEGQGQ